MILQLVKVDMKGERRRGSLARTVVERRNEGRQFSPPRENDARIHFVVNVSKCSLPEFSFH